MTVFKNRSFDHTPVRIYERFHGTLILNLINGFSLNLNTPFVDP